LPHLNTKVSASTGLVRLARPLYTSYSSCITRTSKLSGKSASKKPFSCKCRGFCPSCGAKRAAAFAAFLKDELLEDVAHAQWVFTLPKMLRRYFLYNRELLGELCRAGYDTVIEMMAVAVEEYEVRPGMVAVIQTFSDNLNNQGLLNEERIKLLLSWEYTGFSIDNSVTVYPSDTPFTILADIRIAPNPNQTKTLFLQRSPIMKSPLWFPHPSSVVDGQIG
jgi:hypothetical protein